MKKLLFLMLFFTSSLCGQTTVTLEWDHLEFDLDPSIRFVLERSTQLVNDIPSNFTVFIDNIDVKTITFNLTEAIPQQYFRVRARNTIGLISAPSNIFPIGRPGNPSNLRIVINVTVP